MGKPVSLSVHKNNRAQREAKRVRQFLKDDMREIVKMRDLAGYAVVAWNDKRAYVADFYTPNKGPMPATAMPDYVKNALLRELVKADINSAISPIDDDGA